MKGRWDSVPEKGSLEGELPTPTDSFLGLRLGRPRSASTSGLGGLLLGFFDFLGNHQSQTGLPDPMAIGFPDHRLRAMKPIAEGPIRINLIMSRPKKPEFLLGLGCPEGDAIASVAKQSQSEGCDCFASLAMTIFGS